jgi:hypothetical protein
MSEYSLKHREGNFYIYIYIFYYYFSGKCLLLNLYLTKYIVD